MAASEKIIVATMLGIPLILAVVCVAETANDFRGFWLLLLVQVEPEIKSCFIVDFALIFPADIFFCESDILNDNFRFFISKPFP